MEALAAGVPFAQPDNGVSPELRELTGGGILYSPNDAEALAGKLQEVLLNPQERLRMARQGREAAVRLFGAERMAGELLKIYQTAVIHYEGR
jgi:glycosyltransferase involved in cell wall biosynthesis